MATSIGLIYGFDSGFFAIAVVVAFFIIYDAKVVRGAAGKQAQSLNRIIESLDLTQIKDLERLKEVLGHSLVEIFFGGIIGIACALIFNT
jgi:acid phosphatase family membrane protein YuiD